MISVEQWNDPFTRKDILDLLTRYITESIPSKHCFFLAIIDPGDAEKYREFAWAMNVTREQVIPILAEMAKTFHEETDYPIGAGPGF